MDESLTVGGQTYTIARAYDSASRLTSIVYPDGSMLNQSFTSRGFLERLIYKGAVAASFTYDPGGRRSTRTLGDSPGTTTTWGYAGGDNEIAAITTPGLPSFSYSYDQNNNRTVESASGVLQPYGYSTGASGYDNEDRRVSWTGRMAMKPFPGH